MKSLYQLLLCSISVIAIANPQPEHPNYQQQPDPETHDRMWREHMERHQANAFSQNALKNDNPAHTELNKPNTTSASLANSNNISNSAVAENIEKLDPELRALVLDLAPISVRKVAENIKKRAQNQNDEIMSIPSCLIFVGKPGSGKTTLVQAIAEEANIRFIKLNAPYSADKYKNSGPEKLREFFDSIKNTDTLTLVAIDEFHRYTDGYKKLNEPDPGTAETFWLLVDDCKKNKNIIIVGITNDSSEMAPQITSRFGSRIYQIKPVNESIFKQRVLHYCLSKNTVSNNCNQKCEKKIASVINSNDVRAIQDIVNSASEIASERKSKDPITQKDLEESVKQYHQSQKNCEKKQEDKTPVLQKFAWVGTGVMGVGVGLFYAAKAIQIGLALANGDTAEAKKAFDESIEKK